MKRKTTLSKEVYELALEMFRSGMDERFVFGKAITHGKTLGLSGGEARSAVARAYEDLGMSKARPARSKPATAKGAPSKAARLAALLAKDLRELDRSARPQLKKDVMVVGRGWGLTEKQCLELWTKAVESNRKEKR